MPDVSELGKRGPGDEMEAAGATAFSRNGGKAVTGRGPKEGGRWDES